MAWQDRPYSREPVGQGGPLLSRLGSHSMVTWLLGINFGVWVLDIILSSGSRVPNWAVPYNWGNFNVAQAILGLQLWRLVTYQFLHLGFLHLLFNMIGLFFFGPLMEQWWGSRRFLAFYLLCGVSGAVVMSVLSLVPGLLGVGPHTALVGASGSLFGILIGAAVLFPHLRVQLLLPPIPMTMRTMAMIFLAIAVLSVLADASNAGGEAAHLGGALLGFILVKNPRWLDWADSRMLQRWRHQRQRSRWERQRRKELELEAQVDRILDKVREHGLPSLTRREKRILRNATERHRRTE